MDLNSLSSSKRNALLIRLTCFFWLVAKLISYKLWLADRMFPLVPPFHFLVLPPVLHLGLYIISLIGLIWILIDPANVKLLIAVVVLELISCLFDQNRWQPWEYQYIFTLLIFIFNRRNEDNGAIVLRWMIAAIYFYGGLSKLNPAFVQSMWHDQVLIHTFRLSKQLADSSLIHRAGYLLGLLEASLGIGLLFVGTRKLSTLLLISMHVLVLIVLGPLGRNFDTVVWPWNILMIGYLFVLVLYFQSRVIFPSFVLLSFNSLVVLLFGIMPALNFVGCWDYYLSSSLFSYKPPVMYIVLLKSEHKDLETFCTPDMKISDSTEILLSITHWSYEEMKVPVYPEIRVYKDIRDQLTKRYPDIGEKFLVFSYPNSVTFLPK